jgi:hypothetical protein
MLQSGIAMECSTLEREKSCPQLIHDGKQERKRSMELMLYKTDQSDMPAHKIIRVIIRQLVSTIHSKMSLRDVPAEAWSHFRPINRCADNEARGDVGPS